MEFGGQSTLILLVWRKIWWIHRKFYPIWLFFRRCYPRNGQWVACAYDPGNLTRIYNVFSSTSYHLTKEYDGTNSTASASFNTSSPSVTGALGAIPTGLTVTLNNPTFTYDNVNQEINRLVQRRPIP